MIPFPVALVPERSVPDALVEVPGWGLVSIRDGRKPPLEVELAGHCPRLDLAFDDWSFADGVGRYVVPGPAHARAIVTFARALATAPPPGLLVHCTAGVSRSAAALAGVLHVLDVDPVAGLDAACALALERGWRTAPACRPNVRLVALLDRELEAEGALLARVLERWPIPSRTLAEIRADAEAG